MKNPKNSNKKIKYQDIEYAEIAEMFFNFPEEPTPYIKLLKNCDFDFTIESLTFVDSYLSKVRKKELTDDEWIKIILRCGAYVGEVIRRNSDSLNWRWIDFESAVLKYSYMKEYKGEIGVAAVLCAKDILCCPLAKIEKFLMHGKAESVKLFAQVAINPPDE